MNVQKKIAFGFIRAKLNSLALINRRKAGEEAFRIFCTPFTRSKKLSEIFNEAEILPFSYKGNRITGYRFNHPCDHKVLILHGFSSSSHNFDKYIQPLVDKNYEVLAFDAAAHGFSEGNSINAVEYGELIRQFANMYGPINGYIAHSFGGLAVCLALESMPHPPTTKLALIAPATETTSAIENAFMILGLKNPNVKKALEDTILTVSGKDAAWFSVRRAMNHIKAKVMWFHDEDDDTTPLKDALKVKDDNHAHVQFRITRGLGHSKIYRNPDVRKQIVDFL
jgi:pimeloyl-ACP methyl ester carboxylesterase